MKSQSPERQSPPELRAVIITALPVEFSAVCEHLERTSEIEHPHEGSIYTRGLFSAQGRCWEVFVVEAGTNNAGAAVETERAIREFKPKVALLIGVAGGLKDVKPGDVVVASGVYNYESGKETDEFLSRPKGGESSYPLMQRARAEARAGEWQSRIKNKRPEHNPQARIGPIVAGEKVLTNTHGPVYLSIRRQYNDALAVEMEGSGFMEAVRKNANLDAIVVRGISDLLDGKSKMDSNGWQEVASRHASAFAFEILAKLRVAPNADTAHNGLRATWENAYPSRQDAGNAKSSRAGLAWRFFFILLLAYAGYWAVSEFSRRQANRPKPREAVYDIIR